MKKFVISMVAGLCLLGSAGMVEAKDLELFVRNRPFEGVVVTQAGSLNASLGDLLQSLGYSWTVSDRTINVHKQKFSADVEVPKLSGRYSLQVEGVGVPVTVKDIKGVTCVNLEAFAKALGLTYKTNHALGCADLIAPVEKSKIVDPTASAPKKIKSKKPAGMVETNGQDGKSPLVLTDMPFQDSTIPNVEEGLVRTSAVLQNTGDKDITNVSMKLSVCNLNGDAYYSWEQHAPTIKAGDVYNFNPDPPVWHNFSQLPLKPMMSITHDPIPEDEEEEEAGQ